MAVLALLVFTQRALAQSQPQLQLRQSASTVGVGDLSR